MVFIDQYAYINKLRTIHPMEKFSLAMMTLVICLVFNSWLLHFCVITMMTFLVFYGASISASSYIRLMGIPFVFLIFGILGIALSITQEVNTIMLYGIIIDKWMIGFTTDGVSQAFAIFMRSYAGVSCLYFLALTTPMVDLIWVLKKIRIPVVITELMTIVYRFIFVLIETAYMIRISQECRLGYTSIKRSYHSIGLLITNLFINSFIRARELFVALSARGYKGELIVLEEEYQTSKRNILIIACTEIILLSVAIVF